MTEEYFIQNLGHSILGPDKAEISWSIPTSEPLSTGQVLYWEKDQPMKETDKDPEARTHSIELTGLKPNTRYYYRARSTRADAAFPGGRKSKHLPRLVC